MSRKSFWRRWRVPLFLILVAGAALYIFANSGGDKTPAFRKACGVTSGRILDEALCAYQQDPQRRQELADALDKAAKAGHAKTAAELVADRMPAADEDYFIDMDYGATKNPAQVAKDLSPFLPGATPEAAVKATVIGRNNWIVWTAGNDRFWDVLSKKSLGNIDLLKSISNAPNLKFNRGNRWEYLGLVNEPCFRQPALPRADRYGLWLDERDPTCPPDPFENERKYPGVKIGARGVNGFPVGSLYGYATGIVGLRLFPNPDFDQKAAAHWDWQRYYTDPSYYNDENLVRPYRVGMSCGFCHVGPSPTHPPADPNNPKWENLNSNPGAQYFWIDRIFPFDGDRSNYVYQLFHVSRPGALDTSLVSSDYINNPRTMNAVYSLGARMTMALAYGKEQIAGGERDNKQFNQFVPPNSFLDKFYQKSEKADAITDTVFTPRVLKDGSDSVGALGALNRVFVNIGLFGDEWITHFNPIVGGSALSPIEIKVGRANSAYWVANERQTPDLGLFFLATAKPDDLAAAPDGAKYLSKDPATLARGRDVFAENCAGCHSSKLPKKAYSFFPDGGANGGADGKDYIGHWKEYWAYLKTDEFKTEMKKLAASEDFVKDNFLSTDQRVPVTVLETNICSPIATNAIRDNIWDNFSSDTYKNLPSVGEVTLHDPFTGEKNAQDFPVPGGGRGFTRPASLISLWATAPYLQNNSVGPFNPSPSVDSRIQVFQASIEQMLWPEKRAGNVTFETRSGKTLPGLVDLTTETSYLRVPFGFVPSLLRPIVGLFKGSHFVSDKGIEIGPIPKGTPANLISNIDLDVRPGWWADFQHKARIGGALLKLILAVSHIGPSTSDDEARALFRPAAPALIAVSKCPDYIVNRGHYFGTQYLSDPVTGAVSAGLSDAQKHDLIEFLKTF